MMRLLLITFGCSVLWACSGPQDFTNMSADELVSGLEVQNFTSKDQTPGVYSKLRKIRDYRLNFDCEFLEDAKVVGLHVDSVLVPMNIIGSDGRRMESQNIAKANKESYLLTGNRFFYNPEAPDRGMEVVIYESMPETLKPRHACLLLESHGQNICIDLGEIEKLEPVIAP